MKDGVNQIKNYGISLAQYMNFPPDVISKAVVISEELRQKQLPNRPNRSNAIANKSSMNRRSTHRSTLLETTTSEQSHLLRLFYNLFADMVSINRLPITIEEKQDLLTKKMRELADDLPPHILDMAREGTLFDLFKRSQNAMPTNFWTPPEQEIIDEEEPQQQVDASQPSHNTTNFSLLSENSVARRRGLELQDMSATDAFTLPPVSNIRNKATIRQQSKVKFSSDSQIEEIHNPQSRGNRFNENRFSNDDDSNFNFMDASMDFIDNELSQYRSDGSPIRADLNFEDEPYTSGFLIPDMLEQGDRLTNSSGILRSNQNASTDAQPVTSSKDYTKTKSSHISQRSSTSSSSSGLFRLRLKSPLKVRDNRILKTPPKNSRSVPSDDFSFGNSKESTKQRSASRLSFSLLDDDKNYSGVGITEIPSFGSDKYAGEFSGDDVPTMQYSDVSGHSNDSTSQPFQLNLTQMFSREAIEDSFLYSQDFQAELSDDIVPIPSQSSFRDAANTQEYESFAFPDIPRVTSNATKAHRSQFENSYTECVSSNTFSQLSTSSQGPSGNFFNLKNTFQDSSKGPTTVYKLNEPINQSFIRKVTVAPKITPPTGLQFIQHAYGNESDDESMSDDEQIQSDSTEIIAAQKVSSKVATISTGSKNKFQPKTVPKYRIGLSRSNVAKDQPEPLTESSNINTTVNEENVEDIILPVPPQFL